MKALEAEAVAIEKRIAEFAEMEEKGFLACENGHEIPGPAEGGCPTCGPDMKLTLVKRSEMSGQEKYESDKERKDAENLAKAKRQQAEAEQENAKGSDSASKYFHDLAANGRHIADRIRSL